MTRGEYIASYPNTNLSPLSLAKIYDVTNGECLKWDAEQTERLYEQITGKKLFERYKFESFLTQDEIAGGYSEEIARKIYAHLIVEGGLGMIHHITEDIYLLFVDRDD